MKIDQFGNPEVKNNIRIIHTKRIADNHIYNFFDGFIDLIIGDRKIRQRLENMESIDSLAESWQAGLDAFAEDSQRFHLYR